MEPGAVQGRRPHLQVTVGLSTLAGLNDLPAELAGHGAITAGMARAIATSAGSLCTLIADETTGAVIAAGAHTYRPRQDLRDQLTALVDSCRFPSCRQPVWRCDIDHRNPFNHRNPDRGGHTTLANTDPLCRRHHLFKHHTAWTLRRDTPTPADPAGLGVTWTSPTGHTYNDPPRQVTIPGTWSSPSTGGPNTGLDDEPSGVDPDPAAGPEGDPSARGKVDPPAGCADDPSAGNTVDPTVACGGEMGDSAVDPAADAGVDPAAGCDTDPGTGGIADPTADCKSQTDGAAIDPSVAVELRKACRSIPDFLERRRLRKDPGSKPAPFLSSRARAETEPEPADTGTDDRPATDENPGTDPGSSSNPGTSTDGAPADPSSAAQDAPFTGLGEADLISLLLRLYLITRPRTGNAPSTSAGVGDTGFDDLPDAAGVDDDPPPF